MELFLHSLESHNSTSSAKHLEHVVDFGSDTVACSTPCDLLSYVVFFTWHHHGRAH